MGRYNMVEKIIDDLGIYEKNGSFRLKDMEGFKMAVFFPLANMQGKMIAEKPGKITLRYILEKDGLCLTIDLEGENKETTPTHEIAYWAIWSTYAEAIYWAKRYLDRKMPENSIVQVLEHRNLF